MPPRLAGGGGPPKEEQTAQLLLQMAQSSQRLTDAGASLATSQAFFMRSAADADVNIGLSKSHPYVHVEKIAARRIDNTVDDNNRSGLPTALRDTRPRALVDYVSDVRDPEYDVTDPRHANDYGAGHDDATTERADALTAFHRDRGRNITMLEKQLPADGYMNTFTTTAGQLDQWEAHPLALTGSLNEGDVRKGEFTMSKFLNHHRWYTEYGKVYNSKQFMLNLSTTHAEDLCSYHGTRLTTLILRDQTRSSTCMSISKLLCGGKLRQRVSPLTQLIRSPSGPRQSSN